MRRKGRERRLRFFDRGNTRCPICLEPFSREGVKKGREVTLEHAPPKTLGGVEMCLTCTSCNRSAGSSLDQAAALAHRIGEEQSAGHGVRVLLEVCGIKRTTYFRPEGFRGAGSSLARNPAAQQLLSDLPGHDVVVAAEFRKEPGWDLSKGIAIRKIEPDWDRVRASWLRSAYLMVFSLLGVSGNRYAASASVVPIRHQILNGALDDSPRILGEFPETALPENLILMNNTVEPFCWMVKLGKACVILPHGGSEGHYRRLADLPSSVSIGKKWPFWRPVKFGKAQSVELQCCPTNFSAVRVESVRFCDQGVRFGVRTGPGAVFARTG